MIALVRSQQDMQAHTEGLLKSPVTKVTGVQGSQQGWQHVLGLPLVEGFPRLLLAFQAAVGQDTPHPVPHSPAPCLLFSCLNPLERGPGVAGAGGGGQPEAILGIVSGDDSW
jgi:hypothetical protein